MFQFNNSDNRQLSNVSGQNASWAAKGFINLYLPTNGGSRRKLGAIPLKESKPAEKQLLDWLNEDPSRVQQLLANLEMEYNSAEGSDDSSFKLN